MDPILVLDNDVARRRFIRLALIASHRSVLTFDTAARLIAYLGVLRRAPAAILVAQAAAGRDLHAVAAAAARFTDRPRVILIGDAIEAPSPEAGVSEVLLPPLDRHRLIWAIQASRSIAQ